MEKYAEDNKEFHKEFKGAFVKLTELGHPDLTDGEEFLKDHQDYKLMFEWMNYWVQTKQIKLRQKFHI